MSINDIFVFNLFKVVEVVVDPMLEDVEDAELDGLRVLLSEALQVERHPHLGRLLRRGRCDLS